MGLREAAERAAIAVAVGLVLGAWQPRAGAQVPDWPDVYDPLTLLTLNLSMSAADWNTVQNDSTLSIEVPAQLWADGESPSGLLVAVRRKSADLLGDPADPKVSLKVDVNQFVVGQEWHLLKKLSLENGDDKNVIREGFAWYLHRLAGQLSNSDYDPGLAAWAKLFVNGQYYGVYVNVEQRDKTWLKNRGLWNAGQTWLYKVSGVDAPVLDFGTGDSPTQAILCYPPFGTTCVTPDDATLQAELPAYIDMEAMLTIAAVEAFITMPDALFSKGKNFYYTDFADFLTQRRLYIPWDLDTVFHRKNQGMYLQLTPYQTVILNHPFFKARYEQILRNLLIGPFQMSTMSAFLDAAEPILTPPLEIDPANNLDGPIGDEFVSLKSFLQSRINVAANAVACAADTDGDGYCDGTDNCISLPNGAAQGEDGLYGQLDFDQDGAGNACDPDDDDDGLDDLFETNTGIYVSPTNTGTDPLNPDSDGDGYSDAFEVSAGSNPNDALSTPGGSLPDFDGDGVEDTSDTCPTVFDSGLDADGDAVDDACDTCVGLFNPPVADPAAIDPAFPAGWMTLVSGQRDDDADGAGNQCDADFDQVGATVGGTDLVLQRAAFNHDRSGFTCGGPCDVYDMDEIGSVIGGDDLTMGRLRFGTKPGPGCSGADADGDGIGDACDANPAGPSGTPTPGFFGSPAFPVLDRALCEGTACP